MELKEILKTKQKFSTTQILKSLAKKIIMSIFKNENKKIVKETIKPEKEAKESVGVLQGFPKEQFSNRTPTRISAEAFDNVFMNMFTPFIQIAKELFSYLMRSMSNAVHYEEETKNKSKNNNLCDYGCKKGNNCDLNNCNEKNNHETNKTFVNKYESRSPNDPYDSDDDGSQFDANIHRFDDSYYYDGSDDSNNNNDGYEYEGAHYELINDISSPDEHF